jgi:hypothetical protein
MRTDKEIRRDTAIKLVKSGKFTMDTVEKMHSEASQRCRANPVDADLVDQRNALADALVHLRKDQSA